MPANTAPIFPLTPVIGGIGSNITAANTARDGTGTVTTIFTAGADGARVRRVIARPLGTNVASVLRIFLNNGSDPTVAANNALVAELSLIATTNSETAASFPNELLLELDLPPNFRLTATLGTAVAAGYCVTAHGGNY